MFDRKTTILCSICTIVNVLGVISGTAPGVLLEAYVLLGVAAGIVFLILILLIIAAALYQCQNDQANPDQISIKAKKENILFIFILSLIFTAGGFLGILTQVLLKAIRTSLLTELLIGAVCAIIIALCAILLLIIGFTWKNEEVKDKVFQLQRSDWTWPMANSVKTSNRFRVNEKVLVDDRDIARVLEADGVGNYRIQYLTTNLVDFKHGSSLRAVPTR